MRTKEQQEESKERCQGRKVGEGEGSEDGCVFFFQAEDGIRDKGM